MPRALNSVSQMVERVLSEQLKTIGETVKSEATALGTLFQRDEATLAKEWLVKHSRVCRCSSLLVPFHPNNQGCSVFMQLDANEDESGSA